MPLNSHVHIGRAVVARAAAAAPDAPKEWSSSPHQRNESLCRVCLAISLWSGAGNVSRWWHGAERDGRKRI